MSGKLKKGLVAFVAVIVVAFAAIGAYSYWTTSGTGTGSAPTGNIGASLHVTQTSDTGPSFTPGGTGQVLGGTVESTVPVGGANVSVNQLVATLATPTGGSNTPNPCTTADYEFVAGNGWTVNLAGDVATHTYASINLTSGASTPWSGLNVQMRNRTDVVPGDNSGNQDGCKTALLNFTYAAS